MNSWLEHDCFATCSLNNEIYALMLMNGCRCRDIKITELATRHVYVCVEIEIEFVLKLCILLRSVSVGGTALSILKCYPNYNEIGFLGCHISLLASYLTELVYWSSVLKKKIQFDKILVFTFLSVCPWVCLSICPHSVRHSFDHTNLSIHISAAFMCSLMP